MKRNLLKLISMCSGKLFIEIDNHKLYNSRVDNHIREDETKEFANVEQTTKDLMIANNSIIRVEAHPKDLPISVVEYSHDIEVAIKNTLAKIKEAEKEAKKNG